MFQKVDRTAGTNPIRQQLGNLTDAGQMYGPIIYQKAPIVMRQLEMIVGETPLKYVTQVRMHQARQWLTQDRMRISVVAARLGYESEASFSRAFKRVIGSPPSRFRTGETG